MYRTYFKCLVVFAILQSFEIRAALQDYLFPSCNQRIECTIYTGNRSDRIEIGTFDDYPNLRILRVLGSNNLDHWKKLTTNVTTIYTNDFIYLYNYMNQQFDKLNRNEVEPRPKVISNNTSAYNHNTFTYCIKLLSDMPLTPKELNCVYDEVTFDSLMNLRLSVSDMEKSNISKTTLAMITYVNFSGKHIYVFNMSAALFSGVKRINIRNTTIDTVSAKSFSDFQRLKILTMSDTLNNIRMIDIFESNAMLRTIDTPSAVYWRKNATTVEKFDRRTKCFSLLDLKTQTTATGCLVIKTIDPFDDTEFMAGSYLAMMKKQANIILMGIGAFHLVFALLFCLKK